jgi:hypothetical protein
MFSDKFLAAGVLLAVQKALGNVPLENWGLERDPCSSWEGVICNNGLVTSL